MTMGILDDITTGLEKFNAMFEAEDESTSSETTVDIEVKVAEEVTAPEEEAVEAIEETEEVAEAAEEMLARWNKLEHSMAVVEKYGLSRPVAELLDPSGTMFTGMGLPGLESMDEVGSPASNTTVVALEGFKETMKRFWDWIKSVCAKIAKFAVDMFRKLQALFTSKVATIKRISEAIKKADKFDEKKLGDKKVKILSASQWTNDKTYLIGAIHKFRTMAGTISDLNISNKQNFNSDEITGATAKLGEFPKASDIVEKSLSDHGYKKDFFTNTTAVLEISKAGAGLTEVGKKLESAAKKIGAEAAKYANSADVATEIKENAKASVKALNAFTKHGTALSKAANTLVKMWLKAAYAFYTCRGEAKAAA